MRKISANYIYSAHTGFIKNGILTLDNENRVTELKQNTPPLKEEASMEFYNGIICPGFINTHCHLELSHMHGKIAEGGGLDNFIHRVISSRKSSQEEIDKAIILADKKMIKEGIVAVGDISNKEDSFKVKSESRIFYHNFIEIFSLNAKKAQDCFDNGLKLRNIAREKYHLKASLVPHAPYSLSSTLFSLFKKNLISPEELLSIHSQETIFENEFISERKGRLLSTFVELGMEIGDSVPRHINSLQFLIESIPEKNPLLLVHNTHTNEKDIKDSHLNLSKTWFCLCPNSNYYIARESPGTFLIDNYPDNVCIGTDGLSSNRKLSVLDEIKRLQSDFPQLKLETLLKMATQNGADALQVGHKLGSFENGKKAGVILIEKVDLQNLKLKKESRVKVLI